MKEKKGKSRCSDVIILSLGILILQLYHLLLVYSIIK